MAHGASNCATFATEKGAGFSIFAVADWLAIAGVDVIALASAAAASTAGFLFLSPQADSSPTTTLTVKTCLIAIMVISSCDEIEAPATDNACAVKAFRELLRQCEPRDALPVPLYFHCSETISRAQSHRRIAPRSWLEVAGVELVDDDGAGVMPVEQVVDAGEGVEFPSRYLPDITRVNSGDGVPRGARGIAVVDVDTILRAQFQARAQALRRHPAEAGKQ